MTDNKILGLEDVYNSVQSLATEVRGLSGELRANDAQRRTDVALLQRDVLDLQKDVDGLTHAREADAATRTKNRWAMAGAVVTAFIAPYALELLNLKAG